MNDDVRFRIRLYDQRKMEVDDERFVPMGHSVKLMERRFETGPGLHHGDCLFVANGLGFDLRFIGGIHVYVHDGHGLNHVNSYDAETICIRDHSLVLPIDPPNRGYVMVNSQIGISFDFVGADGNRLDRTWAP